MECLLAIKSRLHEIQNAQVYNRREGQGAECGTHGAELTTSDGEISSVPTNKASAQATPSRMPLVHFASEASRVGGTRIPGASRAWR